MCRTGSIALALTLGCLVHPALIMASPVYYAAYGSVVDKQGRTLPIDGGVYIDDQLREWAGNEPGQPTEVHDQLGLSIYQYSITGYSLNVGEYAFAGASGMMYMPLFRYPTLNDWGTGDLMWFLEQGNAASQWTEWVGEDFSFYNADGTAQEISRYATLAETINFAQMLYLPNDPILPDGPPFSLWLVKADDSAPAPEPSTMVLLLASLAGAGLWGKLHPRRR